MSEEDSAKISERLHAQNQTSSSHTEFKNAPVADLSGSTSGGQGREN